MFLICKDSCLLLFTTQCLYGDARASGKAEELHNCQALASEAQAGWNWGKSPESGARLPTLHSFCPTHQVNVLRHAVSLGGASTFV